MKPASVEHIVRLHSHLSCAWTNGFTHTRTHSFWPHHVADAHGTHSEVLEEDVTSQPTETVTNSNGSDDDVSSLVDRVLRKSGKKSKKRRGAAVSGIDAEPGWITSGWFDEVVEGSVVMAMDGPAWYVLLESISSHIVYDLMVPCAITSTHKNTVNGCTMRCTFTTRVPCLAGCQ